VRTKLREASLAAARGAGAGAAPVFVDAEPDELPGALTPSGTYVLAGETVRVDLVLADGDREVARLQIEGSKDDLAGLAAKLVTAIHTAASRSGGRPLN
jgi:hypothetical protein